MTLKEDIRDLKGIVDSLARSGSEGIVRVISNIFDNIDSYVIIINSDFDLLFVNHALRSKFPSNYIFKGKCYNILRQQNTVCTNCHVERVLQSRRLEIIHNLSKPFIGSSSYVATCIPLIVNGVAGAIEIVDEEKAVVC